jgi:hypothetical protein
MNTKTAKKKIIVPMGKCDVCHKLMKMTVSWKRFCSTDCRLENYYMDRARKAGRI